jgi:hypothetical protein
MGGRRHHRPSQCRRVQGGVVHDRAHTRGKDLGLDTPIFVVNPLRLERSQIKICLLVLQSLAARAQARAGLLREAANAHAEAAATKEATLQAKVKAT